MRRAQGVIKAGRVWGSFVAAGSLLFHHTFHADRLTSLSSPLSHVVGASYQLSSHPFLFRLTVFLSLLAGPCQVSSSS